MSKYSEELRMMFPTTRHIRIKTEELKRIRKKCPNFLEQQYNVVSKLKKEKL